MVAWRRTENAGRRPIYYQHSSTAAPAGPPRPDIKIKPPSPLPKGLFVKKKKPTKAKPVSRSTAPRTASPVIADSLVIQILPHENGEIFLSKRALDQNPDFFGYPFSGRTTPKKGSNTSYPQRQPDPVVRFMVFNTRGNPKRILDSFGLNMVHYEKKSDVRITVPPEVAKSIPDYSILVMRQVEEDARLDYEIEVFPPKHSRYEDFLQVCNQTLPSGGKKKPRRMGWL